MPKLTELMLSSKGDTGERSEKQLRKIKKWSFLGPQPMGKKLFSIQTKDAWIDWIGYFILIVFGT